MSSHFDAGGKCEGTGWLQAIQRCLLDEFEAILSTFSGKTMENRLMTVCTVLLDIVQQAAFFCQQPDSAFSEKLSV